VVVVEGMRKTMKTVSQQRLEVSISHIQAHGVATTIYSVECVELYLHSTMRLHSAMLIKHGVTLPLTFTSFNVRRLRYFPQRVNLRVS
jgi:hypothetical protein